MSDDEYKQKARKILDNLIRYVPGPLWAVPEREADVDKIAAALRAEHLRGRREGLDRATGVPYDASFLLRKSRRHKAAAEMDLVQLAIGRIDPESW